MTYLAHCPPAIAGQGGNSETAKLAKAVVLGFDLDAHTALSAFRPWNATCVPPWSDKELLRLLEAAAKWPGTRGNLLTRTGSEPFTPPPPRPPAAPVVKPPPNLDGFHPPTLAELRAIHYCRELGLPGLVWAAQRGVLVTGYWRDWPCYGITDASGRVLEVRRVDNEPFPEMGALPQRKSHSLKGSEKAWPIGIADTVDYPAIMLVEGIPDFLVAHDTLLWEQGAATNARFLGDALPDLRAATATIQCAPVAMLSASPAIAADALPFFKGKRVKIFAHADLSGTGLAGAEKWRLQIEQAGATSCTLFDLSAYHDPATDEHPNDLDEFMAQRTRWQPRQRPDDWTQDFKITR